VFDQKQSLGAADFTADRFFPFGNGGPGRMFQRQKQQRRVTGQSKPRPFVSGCGRAAGSSKQLGCGFWQHFELMVSFIGMLRRIEQSLRQCLTLAGMYWKNSHPYYWAGFSVTEE